MRRNTLSALSAVIWSVAVVIVVAFTLGAVLNEFSQALGVLTKALGGAA